MTHPMTLTCLGVARNASIESEIQKHAAKLDADCRGIVSCHVVLDLPHKHHRRGNPFGLRIAVSTSGDEVVVQREGLKDDLSVVVRDAFDIVRRRLQDHAEKRRAVAG